MNPKLLKIPIVVLLNKSDLFEKELERNDFTIYKDSAIKARSKESQYCIDIIKDEITKTSGILIIRKDREKKLLYYLFIFFI